MALFLHAEVKLLFLRIKLLLGLVGVQGEFGFVDEFLVLRFLHQAEQALAFRLAKPRLVQQQSQFLPHFVGVFGWGL